MGRGFGLASAGLDYHWQWIEAFVFLLGVRLEFLMEGPPGEDDESVLESLVLVDNLEKQPIINIDGVL